VMTFGDWEDVQTTMRVLGPQAFLDTLDSPPAGIFDAKSWNYWHLYFKRAPIPPLPTRKL